MTKTQAKLKDTWELRLTIKQQQQQQQQQQQLSLAILTAGFSDCSLIEPMNLADVLLAYR